MTIPEGLTKLKSYIDTYVDRLGNIYDANFKKKSLYLNASGYYCVSLVDKNGKRKSLLVSRVIAETYIEKDRPDRYYINHIDGVRTNNSVENLEWVTAYENNIHLILMNYETHKFKLVIYENNVPIKALKGLKEAEEFLKIDFRLIWNAIKEQKTIDNYSFEYIEKDKNIPKELREYKINNGIRKSVKLLDIETGEIKYFNSLSGIANELNVYNSAVYQAIHDNYFYNGGSKLPKLIKQRYMVAYTENDFPLWTKEQIAKAKNRGSKPVFAYNTLTRKRTIYQSGAEFIKINKLPRSVVTKLLKANKLKEINNWYFVYFVDKPEFRIIEDKIFQLAGHVRDYIVLK